MKLERFFAGHPVFSREEVEVFLRSQRVTNANTIRELLAYHVKKGRIVRVRRGLYAAVPLTVIDPKQMSVDPYLVASCV